MACQKSHYFHFILQTRVHAMKKLKIGYPRIDFLEMETKFKSDLERLLTSIQLSDGCDKLTVPLSANNLFSVKITRLVIDDKLLSGSPCPLKWNRIAPIKINLHSWRLNLDRLPTRTNLVARNITIESPSCVTCPNGIDSSEHIYLVSFRYYHLVSDHYVVVSFNPDSCNREWHSQLGRKFGNA